MRDVDVLNQPAAPHSLVNSYESTAVFGRAPGVPTPAASWNFVGDGHGSYTKAQGYGFVGEGQGDWQQVEVEVDDGQKVRPLCWVMLTLFSLTAVFTMVFCYVVFSTTTTTTTMLGHAEYNLSRDSCRSFYNSEQQAYCCKRYSMLCGGSGEGSSHSSSSSGIVVSGGSDGVNRPAESEARKNLIGNSLGSLSSLSSSSSSSSSQAGGHSGDDHSDGSSVPSAGWRCSNPHTLSSTDKAWCCDHEGVACAPSSTREPTTTLMLYNCAAGKFFEWSSGKKDWCCKHRDLCGEIGEA